MYYFMFYGDRIKTEEIFWRSFTWNITVLQIKYRNMDFDYRFMRFAAAGDNVIHLTGMDYAVLATVLVASVIIGLYFGIGKGSFYSGAKELLTANGELPILPVCFSMLSCFVTSILFLGQPTEAFLFGPQLWLLAPSSIIVAPIVGALFVPFFQQRNCTSVYQFFGERFNKYVQMIVSVVYTVHMVFYMAVILYIPSFIIHQVTGLNIFIVLSTTYLLSTFYATVGGIKALVWLNTFEVIIIFLTLSVILIVGTINFGGISAVWSANVEYDRRNIFNWSVDPTLRYSVLSSFFGSAFTNMSLSGGNQMQIQRFLAVKTPCRARTMLQLSILFRILFLILTVYAGLLMFAFYSTCDPVKSEKAGTVDELFPLYVMETVRFYPGLFGLFLAGFLTAGLGFVSNGLNSVAAIWVDELRGSFFDEGNWDKQSGIWVRFISFLFGVLSFLLVLLISHLGKLISVIILLANVISGSLFGLVCLGMFVPSSNSVGATVGFVCSVLSLTWMAIGNSLYSKSAIDFYSQLNLTVNGCENVTVAPAGNFIDERYTDSDSGFNSYLFEITYLWYSSLAIVSTVVVGYFISLIKSWPISSDIVRNANGVKHGKNGIVKRSQVVGLVDAHTTEPFLLKTKL